MVVVAKEQLMFRLNFQELEGADTKLGRDAACPPSILLTAVLPSYNIDGMDQCTNEIYNAIGAVNASIGCTDNSAG